MYSYSSSSWAPPNLFSQQLPFHDIEDNFDHPQWGLGSKAQNSIPETYLSNSHDENMEIDSVAPYDNPCTSSGAENVSKIHTPSYPTHVPEPESYPTNNSTSPPSLDLVDKMKGYRLLELISEQASNGLVDKVIISQEPLSRFINYISPGAYKSLTHVDFAALDKFLIKPVGVYGSKSEIVRLLLEINVVEADTASLLLLSNSQGSKHAVPSLASGLYIFETPPEINSSQRFYVIYWPEDTTWDDNAASSVAKNRVTFIRYLTKMTDQILTLLSPEHAKALDFKRLIASADVDDDDATAGEDDEEFDESRMFTFSVATTNEQSESVAVRPGFELSHPRICAVSLPVQCPEAYHRALQPSLVISETQQAFLTAEFNPEETDVRFHQRSMTKVDLESALRRENIYLSEELTDNSIQILSSLGLMSRFPTALKAWTTRIDMLTAVSEELNRHKRDEANTKLLDDRPQLEIALEYTAIQKALELYGPIFKITDLATDRLWRLDQAQVLQSMHFLDSHYQMFEGIKNSHEAELLSLKSHQLKRSRYTRLKQKFLTVVYILKENDHWENWEKQDLVDAILTDNALKNALPGRTPEEKKGKGTISRMANAVSEYVKGKSNDSREQILQNAQRAIEKSKPSDPIFIRDLPSLCAENLLLLKPALEIGDVMERELKGIIADFVSKAYKSLHRIELSYFNAEMDRAAKISSENERRSSRSALIREINESYGAGSGLGLTFRRVSETPGSYHSDTKHYDVSYQEGIQTPARLRYTINLLALTADDKHNLVLDSGYNYVPHPKIRYQVPVFCLPIGERIRHIQLFANDCCLLIVSNEFGDLKVFLDNVDNLDNAVKANRTKATFSHTKLGSDAVFAVDEVRALLVLVSTGGGESNSCKLHTYSITEKFSSLTLRGTPVVLYSWQERPLSVTMACFVSGQEEILIVDDMEGRVYSFVTQQWRPAPLHFLQRPSAVFSTPDGSGFVAIEKENERVYARLYHWASFGSSLGIVVELPDIHPTALGISSLAQRNVIHTLMLSPSCHTLQSVSLRVTQQSSEFMFRAQNDKECSKQSVYTPTQHNSLLDCHCDAWTRFPVVPAIHRTTIRRENDAEKWLQFVTGDGSLHQLFAPYWRDMITTFTASTRKPIGDLLNGRYIAGIEFDPLSDDWQRTSSQFHAGEWLIELLCLIPLQICVTRDNRFIPLKDGVWSPDLERSLLGADLTQIVESLTFGWYESLFQSYYIGKKVKVVSSMGQQSVGKSYMINHFTDCSFQGSAMRTTEGCWMSLTPTDEFLCVSLDFEGLDSIERSAQEDTLLVLFNAAVSNLVLFRNNFALSRDIATSFQSFQSSSLVLDPAANPTLFQGRLAIIVKDVIEPDSKEIVKEFSSKLQRIVMEEQSSNFITRLHRGEISIIPWPVIESRKFYTMFRDLKKILHSQPITYQSAGVFLSTMKTLMAKLKTNDWGALDQNLGALRVEVLERMLPTAIVYGVAMQGTEEPLKDIDSDTLIPPGSDSQAVFYLQNYSTDQHGASKRLSALRQTHAGDPKHDNVKWISTLSSYLDHLGEARIEYVQSWLKSNTSRFASHAGVIALQRTFQDAVLQLKAGLQLCQMECNKCRLHCVEPRHHLDGHNCHTDHSCGTVCDFCPVQCGFPAGHDSKHICVASVHLCGQSCSLSSRRGCLGQCTKAIDHIDDDHMCSSKKHECGEPCVLTNIPLSSGARYDCFGRCALPCDEPHNSHACTERSCPIPCQLCKRLCCSDHLHGLNEFVHLCGQEHSCSALCGAQGACEISNVPLKVESTFTGRFETFQYTKYSQVVKRLPCGVDIPEGAIEHSGPHRHDTSPEAFHYCETRCPNCDYMCMLPHGHTQAKHQTSHGSCSKTSWAIEGREDAVFELDGHKYAANDSGAPLLCSMLCTKLDRHVHVDYCRAEGTICDGPDFQHIHARILPQPDRPKDYITHELFWERTGFKDPYTREEQADFEKCDHMCGDTDHEATSENPARPSYCTLPMFHHPQPLSQPSSTQGYVSANGHDFACRNPSIGHQAFHVMFVIDRSSSMSSRDKQPQRGSLGNDRIWNQGYANRLGAVYSALYGFWTARHAASTALAGRGGTPPRRDAYSVILFDHGAETVPVINDFSASPEELLDILLAHGPNGGTNFDAALCKAQLVLETNWSTERSPVVIFLSDGECSVSDARIYDLAQKSLALGKALTFHSVCFGQNGSSYYLRRMAEIANEVHSRGPQDPLAPPSVGSGSYTDAIDTIRLAETFLGFAASLQKQRGSLMRG